MRSGCSGCPHPPLSHVRRPSRPSAPPGLCACHAPGAAVPAPHPTPTPPATPCLRLQVTVLAVFQRLNAQPDLYMNVFGESVLNDAVGMVLFNVIAGFLGGKQVNAGSVFAGGRRHAGARSWGAAGPPRRALQLLVLLCSLFGSFDVPRAGIACTRAFGVWRLHMHVGGEGVPVHVRPVGVWPRVHAGLYVPAAAGLCPSV